MAATATSMRELQQRAKSTSIANMGGGNVQEFFEGNKAAIAAALPKHMTADRMLKVAMHAIRTTPALMECNTASLMGAVIQCSQLGLEPNTVLGHAYLVPFWNGREKRKEVQVIPGYKGLIDLARRSGRITTIFAYEVYETDHFHLRLGTDARIEHEPAFQGRGEVIGFYAVAHMPDGGYQFEFLPREEVDQVRDRSQGYLNALKYNKDHPWISDYAQMGRKTAIRRLSKVLPLSVEFAAAATLDGMAEGGQSQALDDVLTGEYAVQGDDAPPADVTPESDAPQSTAANRPGTEGNAQPSAVNADHYIEQMESAQSVDVLDEIVAEAGDVLTGSEKARATKAYQRNKIRLEESGQGGFL
ncbi:recombinase RecT [Arhodomonas sp. AD133]|uniref:recombinase RecT n=1 Tax=Arhodomonas sp. AD133 TaxID=3415009 RepID=UPI003EBECA71